MLRIAAEIGYSETAFLPRTGPVEYAVRYFSPQAEVAFCGHATIAAAVHLADQIGPGYRVFQTPAGRIDVHTHSTPDGIVAGFQSVPAHSGPADAAVIAEALSALRWGLTDLHPDWPAHVAFAGNTHLVLPAATRERLARLTYDFDALRLLMEREKWTTVHLFWPETGDLFHARDPFPVGGVVEDPATGAAAAAFGGYLNALAGRADRQVVIVQGEDMGRRSRITVRTIADSDRVAVSGTAVPLPPGGYGS
jgi:PhzF family phenazine biosynthesis protein